jgi:hypothetical protein
MERFHVSQVAAIFVDAALGSASQYTWKRRAANPVPAMKHGPSDGGHPAV